MFREVLTIIQKIQLMYTMLNILNRALLLQVDLVGQNKKERVVKVKIREI